MRSVILCEGNDDLWFIAYFLNKVIGWDINGTKWKSPKLSCNNRFQDVQYMHLMKTNHVLAIKSVGGQDRMKEALKEILYLNVVTQDFLEMLQQYGFSVDFTEKSFVVTMDGKIQYFRSRFAAVQKMITEMTLLTFATSELYSLRSLIQDNYGDIVCDPNGMCHDVDCWIRIADTHKYYIGGVVLMH